MGKKQLDLINKLKRTDTSRFLLTKDEIDKLDQGVPLHGMLPLQAILRCNVIPLHNVITITGAEESGKSNMIWEIARIFIEHGGIVVYIGTETIEDTPKQKRILHNPDYMDSVLYYKNANYQKYFEKLLTDSAEQIAEMDPDGEIPVVYLIDSLGNITPNESTRGKTEKQKEKITKDNNMSGAQQAKSNKKTFRDFQNNFLNDRPISVIAVNHQHEKINTMGFGAKKYNPGGQFLRYLNAGVLEHAIIGRNKTITGNMTLTVKIKNKKQKGGAARHIELQVPFTDWTETHNDEEIAVCGYDWDTALVNLLMSEFTSKSQLSDIIKIKKTGKGYTCDEVGIKDPCNAKELGKAIHASPEIVKKLQKLWTISEFYELPPVE